MIALILNKENKLIQSMNRVTILSLKNYFNNFIDAEMAYLIDLDEELNGEILFEDNKINVGTMKEFHVEKTLTGTFDLEYYSELPYTEILDSKVIENLLHVYNGGSVESVPNIMPFEKKYIYTENKLDILQTITDFKKYTREQILKM